MSDWSYKYGKPRSEVHEARYGTTATPPRRGRGGALAISNSGLAVALIAAGVGLAALGAILMKR